MKKVLISCDMPETFLEGLEKLKFSTDFRPDITNEELKAIIGQYYGLIVSTKLIIDKEIIIKGRKLSFIGRAGSGMENIDYLYARDKQINVFNSPEGNSNAVGEHALGMLLALMNNLVRADREVRNFQWLREENRGIELTGKTLGIIGFGNTGNSFAQKLKGFEINLLAYDKYHTGFGNSRVKEVSLEEITTRADIISLHLPYTTETHYFFDKNFAKSLKKKIILINTSRGRIVNTADLIDLLKQEQMIGVCLDVLEYEPLDVNMKGKHAYLDEMTSMENVILSPHIAGWSFESKERIGNVLLEKIKMHCKKS